MLGLLRKKNADTEGEGLLEAYLRIYREHAHLPALLRVSELEPCHGRICSSLHRGVQSRHPDVSAFLYAVLRVPGCISRVSRVVLGPTAEVFAAGGYAHVEAWPRVQSQARRRRYHYDGGQVLAVFVSSITDLDDLIPSLCALQIEWNKMHRLLNAPAPEPALGPDLAAGRISAAQAGPDIRRCLGLSRADWELLSQVWTDDWDRKWADMARAPLDLTVERLPLHADHFEEAAGQWWAMVSSRLALGASAREDPTCAGCPGEPLYLVSSNTHSLANLITGFAAVHEQDLLTFIERENPEDLRAAWQDARRDPDLPMANLLYYALRLYQQGDPAAAAARLSWEESMGFQRFAPDQYPHLELQRIAINRLDPGRLDSRLRWSPVLARSPAVLVNMDYPLGQAAGHVLARACELFPALRGVFILGKSAAMIGRLGDIIIPSCVYDSRSRIRYRFENSLGVRHLVPYLSRIAAFDDQKTITVPGTFLHGRSTVGHLLGDDFTGLEMEAGPFMAALHRHFHRQGLGPAPGLDRVAHVRPPAGFSLGLLHYTSDTPYNIRPSLLSTRLGLSGLEAVYAASLATLQRIMDLEAERLTAA